MKFTDYPVKLTDVSRFQDNPGTTYVPTFDKLKAAGIMGVGIQIGYGIVEDRMYRHFWKNAKDLGLMRLPYFYGDYYSHKGTGMTETEWGIEQARQAWDMLKDDPGEIPLYLDIEPSSYGGKFTPLNIGKITTIFRAFLTEYDRLSGGFAGIYCSPGFLWIFGDWFKNRPIWLAWYDRNKTDADIAAALKKYQWRNTAQIWQYTSDGDIDNNGTPDGLALGMETKTLDFSVFMGTMEEWSHFCGDAASGQTTPVVLPEEDQPTPVKPGDLFYTPGKVVTPDGLNIRNKPGTIGDWKEWMPVNTQVEIIQTAKDNEGNPWARIGHNQWCAIRYKGITYLDR